MSLFDLRHYLSWTSTLDIILLLYCLVEYNLLLDTFISVSAGPYLFRLMLWGLSPKNQTDSYVWVGMTCSLPLFRALSPTRSQFCLLDPLYQFQTFDCGRI